MNVSAHQNLTHRSQRPRLCRKMGKLLWMPFVLLTLLLSDTIFAQPPNALAMKLFVIETTEVPSKMNKFDQHFEDHIAHQINLEKRGIMFAAGPLYKSEEATGGPPTAGMIIIRADSFEDAKAIADADPMHANGIRTYSIQQWSLNEGTFNIRVNFSDQSLEFK